MSKKPPARKQEQTIARRYAGWLAPALIIMFTLWQGSYFPLQFLLLLALTLAAFTAFGKAIKMAREAAILLVIPLLYLLSLLIYADNRYAGLTETLRALVLPLSLVLFLNIDSAGAEKGVYTALMGVAMLGLLAYASVIHIPGGVIESSNRLQSVIQYANTTALLMLIGILYSVDKYKENKKPGNLACCAIFAAALLLTGSRTTLAVALAAVFLYIFVLAGRRGKVIAVSALLFAVCLTVCFGMFTQLRLFRISIYEPTLVERWITYQDAFGMLRGKWLLGIGAGNWQDWQFRWQSAPYNVKYIHNYYLQLLLDCGALAPIALGAAVIPAVIRGLRSKNVHGVILVSVLMHAVLDFDLIFSAVAMIAMYSLSKLVKGSRVVKAGKLRYAATAPLLVLTILWGSEAFSAFADSNLEKGELDKSMKGYNAALMLNPLNTGLYYQMAQSTRDIGLTGEYIRAAIDANPGNLKALTIMALLETRDDNYAAALELCGRLVELRRYSEENRSLYLDVAQKALENGCIDDLEYENIRTAMEAIPKQVNPLYSAYIEK